MYKYNSFKDAYEEVRKYCKIGTVAYFPAYVTFELSNKCNFKCQMCYATYAQEKKEHMEIGLFKKAIDEISNYGSLIRFIGYEEPFFYNNISDAIRYVKERGLLLHITTNGSLLNEQMRRLVIDAKVDSIILSLQGLTKREYCAMRNVPVSTYDKVVDNIRALYKMKKEGKPYIQVTTTVTERDNERDKDAFTNEHLEYADEVRVTGFTHLMLLDHVGIKDIWEKLNVRRPEKIDIVNCYVANYELFVKENGEVYVCCGPFTKDLCVGTLRSDDTIFQMWRSDKANKIRKMLDERKFDNLEDCVVCALGYKYPEMRSTAENVQSGKVETYSKTG